MNILIVEDHVRMRELLKSILLIHFESPIEFWECEDGNKAIELYHEAAPDLICMDIEINNLDGLEASRRILKDDPEANIIIITSHVTKAARERAAALNTKGFLSKDNLMEIRHIIDQN